MVPRSKSECSALGVGYKHNLEWPSLPACKDPTPFFSAVHWASFFPFFSGAHWRAGRTDAQLLGAFAKMQLIFQEAGLCFWSISSLGLLLFWIAAASFLFFVFGWHSLFVERLFWKAWRLLFAPFLAFSLLLLDTNSLAFALACLFFIALLLPLLSLLLCVLCATTCLWLDVSKYGNALLNFRSSCSRPLSLCSFHLTL